MLTNPELTPAEMSSSLQKYPRWVSTVSIALFSSFIIIILWTWLLLFDAESITTVQGMSRKFMIMQSGTGSLPLIIMLCSVITICLWSYLIIYKKHLFFILMITSFVLSEVMLSYLNEISFAIRYTSILVLISLGMLKFGERFREGLDFIQITGVLYLLWLTVNLFINGLDASSMAMIPMQLAIVFGFFFGFRSIFNDINGITFICVSLAWLGVCMTILHLCSFMMVSQPFLAGRFRSFFILPTNFANSYALLFISMLWMAIREQRIIIKGALWLFVAIGFALLFLSGTRNSILMVCVALPLFIQIWKVRTPLFILVTIGILASVALLLFNDSSLISSLGDRLTNFSTKNRIGVWELSWQFIKMRPFVGFGLGKEIEAMAKTMPQWALLNPHNAYLGIWMQIGLVGLILTLVIYFYSMIQGFVLLLSNNISRYYKQVFVLPVALLFVLFVGGYFEQNLASRSSFYQLIWGLSIFLITSKHALLKTIPDPFEHSNMQH